MAKSAVEAGHETGITLVGESTPLIKEPLAEQVHGVGIPSLKQLMDFAVSNEVPISV